MAKGASFNLAGLAAASVLGVAFNLVAVRVVPIHYFGLYALGITVVTLAQVPALMGLDTATVRYVAIGAGREDPEVISGSVQTGLIASAIASLVVSAVLWTQADRICTGLFDKPTGADSVRIIAFALPALVLLRVTIAGIQGLGLMRVTAWLPAVRVGAALALALLVAAVGTGVNGLAIAWTAAAWVALGAAMIALRRVHPSAFSPVPSAWRFRQMLWFALPQTLTGMMFLAVIWTDTLMVAHYLTAADVAVYAIVTRLLTPCSALSSSIGQMFSPRIAADGERRGGRALSDMLKRVTRWNTVLSMPIFLTLMVIPTALLGLFGHRYTQGAEALVILAIGQLINTAAGPLGQVINMSGRPYLSMCNNAAVATLNVILCIFMVPKFGLPGAALSTTLSLTLVNAIKVVQVHHLFSTFPFSMDTVKVAAAGAIAAVIAASVVATSLIGDYASVVLIPALLTLVYVLALRALKFSSDDREVLVAARTRLLGICGISPRAGSTAGDA